MSNLVSDLIRRLTGGPPARAPDEARYKAIVERVPLGIIHTRFDGAIVMANPEAARLFGFDSPDELMSTVTHARDLYADPNDRDRAVRELRETGRLQDFEVHVRDLKTGKHFWVLANSVPLLDDEGKPIGFEASFLDITARKDAENARERLAAIVDSSEDAIVGETLEGIITSWNPGAEALYGYTAAEAVGESMKLIIPSDRTDELAGILLRVGSGERIEHYETVRLHKDGTPIEVAITVSPIRDPSRLIIGASVITRDITLNKRRAREDELVARAVREASKAPDLQSAVESLAEIAREPVTFDRITFLIGEGNNAFRRVAVDGEGTWQAPLDERVTLEGDRIWRAFDVGAAAWSTDTSAPDAEPMERDLLERGIRSYIAVPIVAAGEVLALFSISSQRASAFTEDDVAICERLVREVGGSLQTLLLLDRERELTTRLRELDEMKNEFVGMVVHDLRSPLTVIGGFAEAIQKHFHELKDEEKLEFLGTITRNVADMSNLIDDILDVARLESRLMRFDRKPFDIAKLARTVAHELSSTKEGARIDVYALEGLPLAYADERRQRQVLTNLLSNALKFAGDDPIDVSISHDGGTLTVTIRDRGPGILPEEMPLLFQRFSRVTQLGKKAKGTGLGLYICRLLVEGQGGTIDVQSEVGTGTTFTYTVPAAEEEA